MKKTMLVYLGAVLAVHAFMLTAVNAQSVSEEALRHLARGEAAVELAKSPGDFEAAIREFQEAVRLAPTWPEPYYKLGIVQEKAGKFRDAIVSLERYLQLAPNSPETINVKKLIYKLEFKAEQVLTVPDIINALISFKSWKQVGKGSGWNQSIYYITRESDSSVRVLTDMEYYTPRGVDESYKSIQVTGPIIAYATRIDQCDHSNPGSCPVFVTTEIEVLSKTHVKVRCNITGSKGSGKFSCEYINGT